MQLNTRKTNNPMQKSAEDINRLSPKMTDRWSTNTWKHTQHSSLLEKWKSKPQWDITSHQSERPSLKSSCTVGGNVNWYSHYGRWYGDSLKTRNKTTIWPSNPTPGCIPWGNQNWKRHMYPIVHCITIYNS